MNLIYSEDAAKIKQVQKNLDLLRGKSILILGSTGSILSYASHILFEIVKTEDLNVKLYLQGRKKKKLVSLFHDMESENIVLINDDIQNIFESTTYHFDYIIHGASPAATKYYLEQPVDTIMPNILGTYHALEYCRKNNAKLLYMSSVAIYGSIDKPLICEKDCGLLDHLTERSSYSEAKRMAEQVCAAYSRQYGVDVVVVRVPFTYSPTMRYEEDTRAIPRFFWKILNDDKVEIFADETRIQYTYAGDVISAILFLLINGKTMPDGVYNVATREALRMDQILETFIAVSGSKSELIVKKEKGYFQKNKDVNIKLVSNDKIKKMGWDELFDFEKGLSQVAKYAKTLTNGRDSL